MLQRCFKIYSYEANIIGLKNFSLNEIARCFLNKSKSDTQGKKMHELTSEKLKEYNIQDTLLLKELDNKLGIISVMIMECSWTGSFLFKFYIGELLDNYILREAKKRGLVLKSKPSTMKRMTLDDIRIVGGYVATPKTGLYNHVNICDFKSLYPSIIVGWNIGSDSINEELSKKGRTHLLKFLGLRKIEDVSFQEWNAFLKEQKALLDPGSKHIQSANNSFFKRDIRSFIGDLVENLLNQRAEYKKKLKTLTFDTPEYNNAYAIERVVKEMANSMFGITCDKNSRYFNQYTSEAITYTGQWLNKLSSGIAETCGLQSIYGDTDSVFIVGSDDLSEKITEINTKLKTFLDIEVILRKNIVYLEYEKHFSKLLLLEKKRYTGLLNMKDGKPINKVFSRGTEDVKKSNTPLGKETFKELVSKIFTDGFTSKDAVEYIKVLRNYVRDKDIPPDKLLITTRVSKAIENYKVMSAHSRLAKRLIESGDLLPIVEGEKKIGTRLEYIMIDNHGVNDGVLLEEYQRNFNRNYYWEIQVYAPLRRILECAYPTTDWLEYNEFSDQLHLF
jgi:DNA polymerase elongation subunit (family B)